MRKGGRLQAFTLLELIVVIAIISILAYLVSVGLARSKQRAKLARVSAELQEISTAMTQYAEDHNYTYPEDTSRTVPSGLERYLQGGTWPESVWPNGAFDYDKWEDDGGCYRGPTIYQISYRLCKTTDPVETCRDPILFPTFTRNSAIYYCISGPCIPHECEPTAPGYCVNCAKKEQNY